MRKKAIIAAVAVALVAAAVAAVLLFAGGESELNRYLELFLGEDGCEAVELEPLCSSEGDILRVEYDDGERTARGWLFPDGSFFWCERSGGAFSLRLDGFDPIEYGCLSGDGLSFDPTSVSPLVVRGERLSAIVQPPLAREGGALDGTNYLALDALNGGASVEGGAVAIDCAGDGAVADWWVYLAPRDIAPDGYGWLSDCTLEKFGADNRFTLDGYYYRTPGDYSPSGENRFYLNPAAYIAGKLARQSASADGQNIAAAMLDVQRERCNADGFVPTAPTSGWLSADYGVGAGFFDTRFNTELADALLALGRARGIDEFSEQALRYAAYLNAHALERSTAVGDGLFVDDYAHPDGCARTHCSLNHQLAEALFLLKTGDETYAETANRMILAIERSADDWIMQDGNLCYARYPDGSFGGVDYPYLTYNDLLALDRYLGGNEALERLMSAKRSWMDANGITEYNK